MFWVFFPFSPPSPRRWHNLSEKEWHVNLSDRFSGSIGFSSRKIVLPWWGSLSLTFRSQGDSTLHYLHCRFDLSGKTRTFQRNNGVVPLESTHVGPAVLTLLLIIVHTYGYFSTILCLILNLLIVWVAFGQSHWIMGLLKEGGAKGWQSLFPFIGCLRHDDGSNWPAGMGKPHLRITVNTGREHAVSPYGRCSDHSGIGKAFVLGSQDNQVNGLILSLACLLRLNI